MSSIGWDDFERIGLRVGTIIEVEEFPEARIPAWKLKIDLGKDIGIRKFSAQITALYDKKYLLGWQVLCVCNFEPKRIGPYLSEVLTTGFIQDNGEVVLAIPERRVENGLRLA